MDSVKEALPSWASDMTERILIRDIFRNCDCTLEDLHPYLPKNLLKAWQENVVPKEEEVHFWFRIEDYFEIYTIFYVYLDKFIINPECCRENRSELKTFTIERLSETTLSKISHGYRMLDEIIKADNSLFPEDGDNSLFSRIEHFFLKYTDTCCSCTTSLEEEEQCITCVKPEIIREELIHSEDHWYNTGLQNVHMLTRLVYMRPVKQTYQIAIIPKPLMGELSIHDILTSRAALL